MLVAIAAVGGWVAWRAWFNPAVRFLPPHSPAEWILYPLEPDISARPVAKPGEELSAVFRRTFVLDDTPARARLALRVAEQFSLRINGQALAMLSSRENWKQSVELDPSAMLHRGTNEIQVTVTNRAGPPLLWLVLDADATQIISDAAWRVSYGGPDARPARLASRPPEILPGNLMHAPDVLAEAMRRRAGWLLLSLLVAIGFAWGADVLARKKLQFTDSEAKFAALGALLLIWVVLLVHNFSLLPPVIGFDAESHSSNVRFIQEQGRLPDAGQGWETHQPPLYYFGAANLLGLAGLVAASPEGLIGLRVLSLLFGLGQILLVFASLRLLFPGELRCPLFGAALAAFLPAHLYHAHYVTNETCFALLASAVFYAALKMVRAPGSDWRGAVLLGLLTGGALVTKMTALILLPVLGAALLVHLLARREANWKTWLQTLVLPCAVAALVCGWYYGPLWFGEGVDASRWGYGTGWWQQDGYRTAAYYLRFGGALFHPLYSSFGSFWDGVYATLWSDALCGGAVSQISRPPWDYELLAVGVWLALLPTLVVLVGFARALRRAFQQAAAAWLLLTGALLLFGVAAVYFSLLAPGASQVRASFGLMLLVPFSACFALGFDTVLRGRVLRVLGGTVLIWAALNSVSAHWISSDSAQSHLLRANLFLRLGRFPESARLAEAGLQSHPEHAMLRSTLAESWGQLGRTNEARQLLVQALAEHPNDPLTHLDAGFELARAGHVEDAIPHARRALELAPHYADAARQLVVWLCRVRRVDEALPAARAALHLAPHDAALRKWLDELRVGKVPDTAEAPASAPPR